MADRAAYAANKVIEQWENSENRPRDMLTVAVDGTREAVVRAPNNPAYRDQLAKLLIYQFILDDDRSLGKEAKQHLLHSRSIRPQWPGNWAAYIELKYFLDETDPDLYKAIVQATNYGPWEPAVLQTVTRVGIARFKSMTPEAQTAVIANIQRGLTSRVRRVPDRIVSIMKQEVKGWTVALTQQIIIHLVSEAWPTHAHAAHVRLVLMWWPLLNSTQRQVLSIRMADAVSQSRGSTLIMQVKKAGRLPQLCPMLPRKRFQPFCTKVY